MRSTLDELKQELAELNDFVASIVHVNETLATHTELEVRKYAANRRRFDDAAFVVALYASFENYVEELVAAYASLEAQRLPYANLPSRLLTKHLQRSADLLARGRLGEGRHAGLTAAAVVLNLHNCLNGETSYDLNRAAVVWHDTNLRAKDVDEMFQTLGIENMCTQVRQGDALIQWYTAVKGQAAAAVPSAVIEGRLNDLVVRRNQVAHSGGNSDDLLGVDTMNEAICFISALSTDIFSMVVGYYLEGRHGLDSAATKLVQVAGDGPYKDGRVVVVSPPAITLFVGQPVFVSTSSNAARWGRIQSLRLDNAEHATIAAGTPAPQGIGVRLDFACTANASPIVLPAEDDLVWAPK
nr:MAE_28990/MAE_18760 family HEPN-like nuclease [uncultured Albidiferax sp.]